MKVLIQKFSLPGLYILSAIPLLITLSLYFYPDNSECETQFVIWGGVGVRLFLKDSYFITIKQNPLIIRFVFPFLSLCNVLK